MSTTLVKFQFNCPDYLVDKATKILSDCGVIKFQIMPYKVAAIIPDEKDTVVSVDGKEIQGICKRVDLSEIISELSKAKIACFSRRTMLLVTDYRPQNE